MTSTMMIIITLSMPLFAVRVAHDSTPNRPFPTSSAATSTTATVNLTPPGTAKGVVIEGKVRGNVTATDKIEIRGTAQLRGDIVAPRIAMADGAWVCGTVETKAGASARLRIS